MSFSGEKYRDTGKFHDGTPEFNWGGVIVFVLLVVVIVVGFLVNT
jgi:hypothetical protein